jgi:hypothetical protein
MTHRQDSGADNSSPVARPAGPVTGPYEPVPVLLSESLPAIGDRLMSIIGVPLARTLIYKEGGHLPGAASARK